MQPCRQKPKYSKLKTDKAVIHRRLRFLNTSQEAADRAAASTAASSASQRASRGGGSWTVGI